MKPLTARELFHAHEAERLRQSMTAMQRAANERIAQLERALRAAEAPLRGMLDAVSDPSLAELGAVQILRPVLLAAVTEIDAVGLDMEHAA